ncbi:MAG: S8 family serine peptidase, partial [Chloroflexi bacterium]|nr:S8 family serine peptidase [Chloroflexota bacterium]
MNSIAKVSPAFEPFLADSGEDDRREAVVIYRAPHSETPHLRGRLRELQARLDHVRERAQAQSPVQAQVLADYQEIDRKYTPTGEPRRGSSIGNNTLPVVRVEVTRKSLEEYAQHPDVVAIMPNQKISLISPSKVDYQALLQNEVNEGVTWGLQELDIPSLWKTTRGKDINVAVLDTGVYDDHPALAGKVKQFIVIDPLGRRITALPTFDGWQHGTHVCGTIAGGTTFVGVDRGVAPEANLLVA